MAADRVRPDRAAQVEACLATVMDPELDEPVTGLGFVTGVEIGDAGDVCIGFRLPTYWCAANFAFLMADDMRRAVGALPWVRSVQVTLREHMYADAINSGVAAGDGFQASFGAAAEGGLEGLRHTFLVKAFQRRQAELLDHLLAQGYAPAVLVAMELRMLHELGLAPAGQRLVERYLARRGMAGGTDDPTAPAFVRADGMPVPCEAFAAHLRALRSVAVNAEFNGALCRGLLAARYGEPPPSQPIRIVRNPTGMARQAAG